MTNDARPSPGWWIRVLLGTAIWIVGSIAVLFLVQFWGSTTCNKVAAMSDVWKGRGVLLGLNLVSLLCLAYTVKQSPHPRQMRVLAIFASVPLLIGFLLGLDRDFWSGSFCF